MMRWSCGAGARQAQFGKCATRLGWLFLSAALTSWHADAFQDTRLRAITVWKGDLACAGCRTNALDRQPVHRRALLDPGDFAGRCIDRLVSAS